MTSGNESSDSDSVIWIRTTPDENGTYRLTLELSDDVSVFLTAEQAVQHCDFLLNRVASAVMQAKIYRQLSTLLGGDEQGAAGVSQMIQDYRKDDAIPEVPTPLSARAAVNKKGEPFLVMSVYDKVVGQWDLDAAKDHALHVMMSVHVANNDALYLRLLRSGVGLDEGTARSVIDALAEIEV